MPELLDKLPCASELINANLKVAGQFFLECFAGESIITLGIIMACVPCLKPWDSKFGERFDVLTNGLILLQLISCQVIVASHFAIPCQSLTWARSPQLRNAQYPLGMPGLGEKQQQLVKLGNALVAFTVECCAKLHALGGYFSIENPELTWLWVLEEVVMLADLVGVAFVLFYFKDYAVPYFKPTLAMHNTPTLHRLKESFAPWPGETIPLRGKMWWEGKLQFLTHIAQPYPPALGVHYGNLMAEALGLREAALGRGSPVPMACLDATDAPSLSLRQVAWLEPVPTPAPDVAMSNETSDSGMPELVPMGLGAYKGLTPLQHVEWAKEVQHPSACAPSTASRELIEALEFEEEHDNEEIDAFRQSLLYQWVKRAHDMRKSQDDWASQASELNISVVKQIHGPLLKSILKDLAGDEHTFARFMSDCLLGFPLVGPLPPCEGAVISELPKNCPMGSWGEDDLREHREDINKMVLAKVKELPFSEDILPAVHKDAEQGFMSTPRKLMTKDKSGVNLTRRIPVREERQSGWRTRIVDHETESLVNEATEPCDKVQHDGLTLFVFILTWFMAKGVEPRMWKRDISSAFRRVPIKAEHIDLAWVVWMIGGELWVASHIGMPFGTVSAVYAWHRVGHVLLMIIVGLCKAPLGRYVDDYFGASRAGMNYSGGVCLSVLSALVGFPTDEAKTAEAMIYMVVLGAAVNLDWPRRLVTMHIEEAKAERWKVCLQNILQTGECSSELAAKMAGRLSFSVSVAANRVGRAFIKPFYAQQHAPLKAGGISCLLAWACQWFSHYLTHRPKAVRRGITPRPLLVTWQDAAGLSRWVAAVVRTDGGFLWTRVQTPPHIWDQLSARSDAQIGFQELLGVVLVLGTFPHLVAGSLWVGFGDNDGITHALAKGGGHNPECNMVIGKIWLHLAALDVDLHAVRVESEANIADGPTRDMFDHLQALKAVYVSPKLPDWIHDIWYMEDG